MKDYLQAQYWDSCVLVSYVTGTKPELLPEIDDLLARQAGGHIEVVISTFVIAEVRKIAAKGEPGPPPGEEDQVPEVPFDQHRLARVERFFDSRDLRIIALTPRIADLAAKIGNKFPRLLPPDCVHIATALFAEVDVLFTHDGDRAARRRVGDMLRYDNKIGNPPLRIVSPFAPLGPLWDKERLAPR